MNKQAYFEKFAVDAVIKDPPLPYTLSSARRAFGSQTDTEADKGTSAQPDKNTAQPVKDTGTPSGQAADSDESLYDKYWTNNNNKYLRLGQLLGLYNIPKTIRSEVGWWSGSGRHAPIDVGAPFTGARAMWNMALRPAVNTALLAPVNGVKLLTHAVGKATKAHGLKSDARLVGARRAGRDALRAAKRNENYRGRKEIVDNRVQDEYRKWNSDMSELDTAKVIRGKAKVMSDSLGTYLKAEADPVLARLQVIELMKDVYDAADTPGALRRYAREAGKMPRNGERNSLLLDRNQVKLFRKLFTYDRTALESSILAEGSPELARAWFGDNVISGGTPRTITSFIDPFTGNTHPISPIPNPDFDPTSGKVVPRPAAAAEPVHKSLDSVDKLVAVEQRKAQDAADARAAKSTGSPKPPERSREGFVDEPWMSRARRAERLASITAAEAAQPTPPAGSGIPLRVWTAKRGEKYFVEGQSADSILHPATRAPTDAERAFNSPGLGRVDSRRLVRAAVRNRRPRQIPEAVWNATEGDPAFDPRFSRSAILARRNALMADPFKLWRGLRALSYGPGRKGFIKATEGGTTPPSARSRITGAGGRLLLPAVLGYLADRYVETQRLGTPSK